MRLWWGGSSGYCLLVTSLVNVAIFFGWCCNLLTNFYFWDLTVMLLEHAGDDRHVGDWETGEPQEGSAWLPETEGHQLRDAQRGCCHQVPLTSIGQLWTLTQKSHLLVLAEVFLNSFVKYCKKSRLLQLSRFISVDWSLITFHISFLTCYKRAGQILWSVWWQHY